MYPAGVENAIPSSLQTGTLLPHFFHGLERVAQLIEPFVGVLANQPNTPRRSDALRDSGKFHHFRPYLSSLQNRHYYQQQNNSEWTNNKR